MAQQYEKPYCESCENRMHSIINQLDVESVTKVSSTKGCHLYKKGQLIFEEGTRPNGIFCLHKGKVKVYKTGDQGKDHILRFAKAGEILGYRSLLRGDAYSASAATIEDSVVCCIPQETFFELLEADRTFLKRISRLLTLDLRQAENQMVRLAQKPVRERLAEALLALKEIYGTEDGDNSPLNISLSREDLANMVGTVIETLVRTLAEFKRERLIATDKKKIRILDLDGLVHVANVHD